MNKALPLDEAVYPSYPADSQLGHEASLSLKLKKVQWLSQSQEQYRVSEDGSIYS